jgi:adenine-specific DNA-methyltransferase
MKKITANDPETMSVDLIEENIQQLKVLFPELVTEGPSGIAINVDVLKSLIGDRTVTDCDEKYGLNWHGKRRARQLALTPSIGTLRPCPEESVDWDTTKNLMIEGDNLEVLKLLQKSYAGKVKLIYIDPPYNTGKDFVYPDDYKDNMRNYLELTGQVEGGRKISSNTEASGRFHTNWLNMMYPRMKLARNLLNDNGAIFISINDEELINLRSICNNVFGEENFIATVIWQKVYAPKSSAKHFSEDHDYIVIYAKNSSIWQPVLLERTDEQNAVYRNPDNDSRGPWRPNNLAARNYYSKGTYSILCPSGRIIEGPPKGSYWRVSEERFWEMDKDGRIWWGEDGNNVPAPKIYLSEVKDGRVPQTMWFYKDVGHNQESKKEFLELLPIENSDAVFDTPKPRRLIRRMLDIATTTKGEDIVLDFFAGSGSTGDAVMSHNSVDSGNRRFICVQLPWKL